MTYLPLILFYLPLIVGQFLPGILLAAGIGLLLRRKFGWIRPFLAALAAVIFILCMNLLHLPLICPDVFQPYLTDELRDGIYEFFPGYEELPVISLYYRVTDGREGYLEVTKHMLYGGKMRFTVSVDAYGNVVPDRWD